jgi:hypothetical protein
MVPGMERSRTVAAWLIPLGAGALWISLPWILRWRLAAAALRAHVLVFIVAGLVMIVSGAALLRRRHSAWIRCGASIAAAACGASLLVGIVAGTIPCAGPG